MLSERLEMKRKKYKRFLIGKLRVYQPWQSYTYYYELYVKLYDEASQQLIQFLLLSDTFFEKERATLHFCERFLEQLVHSYDKRLQEDFEKKVYVDTGGIEKALEEVNLLMAFPEERNKENLMHIAYLLEPIVREKRGESC
ncbi:hypothetical protein [Enterococcus faecalis]|uniref:hypothetical protein n=1 Tax=Enterococcus faecalis TaxID=1351 RepID=UPI001CE0524D|nr:hypothetical protein [Enterococcus faecalis]